MKTYVINRPVFHIRMLKSEILIKISKARIKWNFRQLTNNLAGQS